MPSTSRFFITPFEVMFSTDLCCFSKILYADILLMSQKTGECWANSCFFEERHNVKRNRISTSIKELVDAGFLSSEIVEGKKRILRPLAVECIQKDTSEAVECIQKDTGECIQKDTVDEQGRIQKDTLVVSKKIHSIIGGDKQDELYKIHPLSPLRDKVEGKDKISKRETMQEKEIDEQHRHWYDLFKHYTLNTIRSKIKDNDQAIDSLLEMCGPKGLEDALIALQYARGRPKNKPYWVGFVNNYVNLRRNIDNVMGFAATKVQEELAYQQER